MASIPAVLAFLIDWGWLRIGPFIHINIDPVIFPVGPLALRWYGLMYVVGITIGLWFIKGYCTRKGITQDQVYRVLWWCVVGGLVGGRLYFVIQQPNFFSYYLTQPQHILATWEGGMAFFGAIIVVVPMLFWRALKERINPLVMLDAAALFAACGQTFGRIGNLINGDIIGYPTNVPWATVYENPNSWACQNVAAGTCQVPVHPAAGYEMLLNILMIIVLLFLARRFRRPGALMATYLFGYCITQFVVFFARANDIVPLFGWNPGLKQAQWTSIVVFLLVIPISYYFLRYSRWGKPVPAGEVAATYGLAQAPGEVKNTTTTSQDEVAHDQIVTSKLPDGASSSTPDGNMITAKPGKASSQTDISPDESPAVTTKLAKDTPAETDGSAITSTLGKKARNVGDSPSESNVVTSKLKKDTKGKPSSSSK